MLPPNFDIQHQLITASSSSSNNLKYYAGRSVTVSATTTTAAAARQVINKMRKKKLLLTGTLLLMCWATVQLYLFVQRPQYQLFKSPKSWFNLSSYSDSALSLSGNNTANDSVIGVVSITLPSTNTEQPSGIDEANTRSSFDFRSISANVEKLEHDLGEQIKSNEGLLRILRVLTKLTSSVASKSPQQIDIERKFLHSLQYPSLQNDPVIAVLLFSCNRETVKRNLDQLLEYRPSEKIFPIVVSQDCGHIPTRRVIESYGDKIHFIQQPDQSDIVLQGKQQKKFKGYYKISRHYGWALNHTFNVLNYDTVLVVEDDLDISPDFFEYFLALYPILKSDPTIYCISAWNDNGKERIVDNNDPAKLYRSDFFPGLGWMFTKDLWLEFQNKWPKAFWDDWIREPEQRKNRVCIRPELSRTKTFGKKGVSNGLFFEKHLKYIKLNTEFVPFTKMNLSYLIKENYDVDYLKQVYSSPLVSLHQLRRLPPRVVPSIEPNSLSTTAGNRSTEALRIQYATKEEYKRSAKVFGLMDDFKCGVPRTGYQGVVDFMYRGHRVHLAPTPMWSGYNITWK